ncbi:hypothetical protein [Synechococcus sp. CC9605]|nr:hypothetical protein [Synechococcus sp. CC9605]
MTTAERRWIEELDCASTGNVNWQTSLKDHFSENDECCSEKHGIVD